MIGQQLPPLTSREVDNREGTVMKWAFTHLAYYADAALPARTLLSYQRAYAPDSIQLFPRAVNGTPGFLVARWVAPKEARTLIAMEGTREWNQILVWSASVENVTEPVVGEWILRTFRDFANNAQQSLTVAGIWSNAFLHSSEPVIFAGHSLGAAVVEILADRMARAAPGKPVSLCKFGSPRVGTHGWRNNRAPLQDFKSVYCHEDPIDILPRYAMSRVGGTINHTVLDSGFLARDQEYIKYGIDGRNVWTRWNDDIPTAMRLLLELGRSITTVNPWFWHHRNAYRLVMTESSLLQHGFHVFRMRYLELPDENTWGTNFAPGRGIQPDMLVSGGVVPGDVQTGYVPPVAPPGPPQDGLPLAQPITGRGQDNIWRGQFEPQRPRQHRMHVRPPM